MEPFSSDSNSSSSVTLLMSAISSARSSNVQPMSIVSSIIVATMPTTNMSVPTVFAEDDSKLLAVWSSIGRAALCSNGLYYSHTCSLFSFAFYTCIGVSIIFILISIAGAITIILHLRRSTLTETIIH